MSADMSAVLKERFNAVRVLPVRLVAEGQIEYGPARIRDVGRAILFVVVVVLPTLIATLYFTCVAADQYASETRFLVRSPQRASAGLLNGFLQSTGFVRAQDDSYAVTEFIKSRDAVSRLVEKHHLREVLSRPEADLFARYPRVWSDTTTESLYRHYLNFIKIQTDSASGITMLEVRAFRPEDARAVASALLTEAEELVNRLNDRARRDAIGNAQREIDIAEDHFANAQRQLTGFRNREAMIDPDKQATAILELISRLSLDVVEKRARIYQIQQQAPASMQLPALKASIDALEEQISRERARMVGGDSSIAARLSGYESLLLQRDLSSRRIASASTSLETARSDAQRQQLYIESIVEPNLPDHATYPRAAFLIAMTLLVALSAYLIIRSVFSYLSEHVEQ
jgi:capsular polysaccharide transport system permease protein